MKSPKTNYFTYTKDNFIGILFIFPFLLVYEMLFYIVYADNDLKARNLAEILIRDFFSLFGSFGFLVEIIFLISILYYLIKRNKSKYQTLNVNSLYLFFLIIEGFLFGLILILFLSNMEIFSFSKLSYNPNFLENIYLSIGAGVWEEILFRGILLTFFIYISRKINLFATNVNSFISVIIVSLLFSGSHYIGNSGEVFIYYTFIIRSIAGLFLGYLFLWRGIGVVSMTHISYNVIIEILKLYSF